MPDSAAPQTRGLRRVPRAGAEPPAAEPGLTLEQKHEAVANCMLGQHWGTAAGVLLGLPASVRLRSMAPFVFAGIAGTSADFILGYNFHCAPVINGYRKSLVAAGQPLPYWLGGGYDGKGPPK